MVTVQPADESEEESCLPEIFSGFDGCGNAFLGKDSCEAAKSVALRIVIRNEVAKAYQTRNYLILSAKNRERLPRRSLFCHKINNPTGPMSALRNKAKCLLFLLLL